MTSLSTRSKHVLCTTEENNFDIKAEDLHLHAEAPRATTPKSRITPVTSRRSFFVDMVAWEAKHGKTWSMASSTKVISDVKLSSGFNSSLLWSKKNNAWNQLWNIKYICFSYVFLFFFFFFLYCAISTAMDLLTNQRIGTSSDCFQRITMANRVSTIPFCFIFQQSAHGVL